MSQAGVGPRVRAFQAGGTADGDPGPVGALGGRRKGQCGPRVGEAEGVRLAAGRGQGWKQVVR